jgi:hypothetical protein
MAESKSRSVDRYVKQYSKTLSTNADSNPNKTKSNVELEFRFGSRNGLNKMKFENVFKTLLMYGFKQVDETHNLRILFNEKMNEFISQNFGEKVNLRCDMSDLKVIQDYCKTNQLPEDLSEIEFCIKNKDPDFLMDNINIDYLFKSSIMRENILDLDNPIIIKTVERFQNMKKMFRYINRIRLKHDDFPLFVDFSIVKSHTNKDGKLVTTTSIKKTSLFNNQENYEIEIEMDTQEKVNKNIEKSIVQLKKVIRYILSGIQNSPYPISKPESESILEEYFKIFNIDFPDKETKKSKYFIGPSSYTLQKSNISNDEDDPNVVDIKKDFCVTDKADGVRKLLFISQTGKVYLITMNLEIQYTNLVVDNSDLFECVIDGEHITQNKFGEQINIYAAFDIYNYSPSKRDVRLFPFIKNSFKKEDDARIKYRYNILFNAVSLINTFKYASKTKMSIIVKEFHVATEHQSIFQCSEELLTNLKSGYKYEYETDGIIYTPTKLGVGQIPGQKFVPKKIKQAWKYSLKWKPPEFNTIDFYIRDLNEIVNESLPSGDTLSYKIIKLHVGYDNKDGKLNPQNYMFKGEYRRINQPDEAREYKPTLFYPSNPYDQKAHICKLPIVRDVNGNLNIFTEKGELIEDKMIVEFSYNIDSDNGFNWKPLGVRYDKIADLNAGNKNYGNPFHVANSNWHTIHRPVTHEMITQEHSVSFDDDYETDGIYYNRKSNKSKTRSLRDFHNLFVKKILIQETINNISSVHSKTTLIDFAVGKGGDLPKWMYSKLSFVLGIDISEDNIHNIKDGACIRYIHKKESKKHVLDSIFIVGDSSKLLTSDDFSSDTRSKHALNVIMGNNVKLNPDEKGLNKVKGIASSLFDIASIQFALHYMFESSYSLHCFLKNISDHVKVGGYFIGTCYDGKKLFNKLKTTQQGNNLTLFKDRQKIWEVTKRYTMEDMEDDDTCLGLKIGVYQETINREFDEYLVNFDYFKNMMNQYGFTVVDDFNINGKHINGLDSFESLHNLMTQDKQEDYLMNATRMSKEEKDISFLNNYFIFKKNRKVDTEILYKHYVIDGKRENEIDLITRAKSINKKIILTFDKKYEGKK